MEILTAWNDINDRLMNFVYGKVKDTEVSRDIVQDVFVKVFSKIDTLKNKEKLVSWIYQITRNEIVSHFRETKINLGLEELEITEENLTSEVAECVELFMNCLPDKYKEALILADIEKIPQKEIAERLNISYSGAKSRVQRGREMLKAIFNQYCEITTDVYGNIIDYQDKRGDNCCEAECD